MSDEKSQRAKEIPSEGERLLSFPDDAPADDQAIREAGEEFAEIVCRELKPSPDEQPVVHKYIEEQLRLLRDRG